MSCHQFILQFKTSFKASKSMLLSICWVLAVTFIVFPAAFIKAGFDFTKSDDLTKKQQWDQTTVNLIFNLFDTIGRYFGGKIIISSRATVTISIARTVLVFTTLATAIQAEPAWLF